MTRWIGVAMIGAVIGVVAQLAEEARGAVPPRMGEARWIWAGDNVTGTFCFRREFDVAEGEKGAGRLFVCCDNSAEVFVNGVRLGKAEPLLQLYSFDLTPHLKVGRNVVAMACTNPEGPGGLIAKIFLGGKKGVATGAGWKMAKEKPRSEAWTSAEFDDSAWVEAVELGANGQGPWPYLGYAYEVPGEFPRFEVPGREGEMESLRYLYYLHYAPAQPLIPLWDEWMPMATLWPARKDDSMRRRWAEALASRPMGEDGYIFTLQHDGTGHAQGWPFPLWQQGGGIGWHFAGTGVAGYDAPRATPEGWEFVGAKGGAVNGKGWPVELEKEAMLTTPGMKVQARHAPWLRLNWWAAGLEGANPYVEWTTDSEKEFSGERRIYFSPTGPGGQAHTYMPMGGGGGKLNTDVGETRTMIPAYKHPKWSGVITRLRIGFDNPGKAEVVIKSFHTAFDTRQTVNNLNFVRGCCDYFNWTGDYAFLRSQVTRMRTALRFMMSEFHTRERNCVYTTWPGHEGRSGVRWVDGKKRVVAGEGIGSNYWDLLPFGGEDALATIYYYDTLRKLADVEEAVAAHPEWNVPGGAAAFDAKDLREHAREVKEYGGKRFWNEKTGRFGTVDLDGEMHDYGFTFLNNEAIYFGFATEEQAKSIRAWEDGARVVEGDTATGKDVYRWRFGPRSTTKRNTDYYFWGWSAPESIAFGQQVQDGGAVLGWSYHDLMAMLEVDGPDAAAKRLGEIVNWFDEAQRVGGYRPYYSDPAVGGTMQGANVAGGLGLDKEFFESVLPVNVMLYGFLGVRVTPTGLIVGPRLPKDWPSLRVTGVRYRDHTLTIDGKDGEAVIRGGGALDDVNVAGPDESWKVSRAGSEIVLKKD